MRERGGVTQILQISVINFQHKDPIPVSKNQHKDHFIHETQHFFDTIIRLQTTTNDYKRLATR